MRSILIAAIATIGLIGCSDNKKEPPKVIKCECGSDECIQNIYCSCPEKGCTCTKLYGKKKCCGGTK